MSYMYHAIELSVQVRLNRYGVLEAISYKMAKKVLVMLCHSKKAKKQEDYHPQSHEMWD